MYNKYTFFYGYPSPFSQWDQKHPFIINDIEFNCAEQWMMLCKALLFNDYEHANKILLSNNPAEQKNLGRSVKNFNIYEWNAIAKDVVYTGNYYKFLQNEEYLNALYETKGTLLVEASPYDRVWGVGLAESNPDIQDKSKWLGTNWLGEVLTKLREDIFEEKNDN